jgi:GAF domain-containing protein
MDSTPSSPAQGNPPDLSAALTELANLMLDTPSVQQLLDDVAQLAATVVARPAACGITLRRDRQPVTVASSGPLASLVDEDQYSAGEGPCLHSLTTGQVVTVTDMQTEDRWGGYKDRALSHGVRSSLSLPLVIDGESRGALNLYSTEPHAFGSAQRDRAQAFATHTATALTLVARQANQTELTEQLRAALASRSVIDQAIGVLMAQDRCGQREAFARLRTASQRQNRKLRDIAADVVMAVGGGNDTAAPFNEPG